MYLYKPTITPREMVSQEARIILGPEPDGDAPPWSYREVQVMVPVDDQLFVSVDLPVQRGFQQPGIGPNRTYKVTPMPTGQAIVFKLQPHQYITAMAESGLILVGLIVEHVAEGDPPRE